MGRVHHGRLNGSGQSGQRSLRLHPGRQFLGRDLTTEDIQHPLGTGRTGRDVALLAQHLVLIGHSVRPHASHDDRATHRGDRRDRARKLGYIGGASQLRRRSSHCPHRGDRREVRSHSRAGAGRLSGRHDSQRATSGGRIRTLGWVEQVGRLPAAQVGSSTDGATDTEASGERVDQPVDVLWGAEVMIGQAQQ